MGESRKVVLLGSDAGGTMTDMILVDKTGDFVVGKASTTHQDESIGFMNSIKDAFERWELTGTKKLKTSFPGSTGRGIFRYHHAQYPADPDRQKGRHHYHQRL